MSIRLKKYLSLFLLSLFLFPLVEKEAHALLHSIDNHCHVKTEKHIHELEHNCSICDFNVAVSDASIVNSTDFIISYTSVVNSFFAEKAAIVEVYYSISPRGPPTI